MFVSAHGFEHLNFGNYSKDQIYEDMYGFQGSLILDDFQDGHLLGSTDGLLRATDVYNIPVVPGGIIILHACYSAGTVDRETMPEWIHLGMPPRINPPKNFVGNLAKTLLCNPEGPSGIYAHINRSHQYDYFHPGNKGDSSTYIQYSHMIRSLLDGGTIGISRERARKYTLDYLHQIDQAISIVRPLLAKLTKTGNLSEDEMNILEGNERALFNYSMAAFNFRNYVILGDPMVRIRKGIKE